MHIRRIQCEQGHAVPSAPHQPRGPFPPELFHQPRPTADYEALVERPAPPEGWVKWYRCTTCRDYVRELDLDEHVCEEDR